MRRIGAHKIGRGPIEGSVGGVGYKPRCGSGGKLAMTGTAVDGQLVTPSCPRFAITPKDC
jgi:hypothetical protein